MAHLSSTSLFLLVALATVLVFSASCLFVLANPFPITRATLQNCKVGDLSFSEAARLDDFFVQPYETSIVEGIEIVHVAYDEGKNTLTVNDNYGSTEVPKPWFVVTRSAEEKALIIPTTNADYVLLKKNVGTAANAGQDAAFKTEITLERGDFPEGDVMDERADQIARFLIPLDSPVPDVGDAFTDYMRSRRGPYRITKLFDRLVIYQSVPIRKAWAGCIYEASPQSGFYHHTLDVGLYILGNNFLTNIMRFDRVLDTGDTKPEYVQNFVGPDEAPAVTEVLNFMPSSDVIKKKAMRSLLLRQKNTLVDQHGHRLQLYVQDGKNMMVYSMEDGFRGRVITLIEAVRPMIENNIAFDVTVSIDTQDIAKAPLDRFSIENKVHPPPKSLKLIFTIDFDLRLVADGGLKAEARWTQSGEKGLVLD
eukprot:GHVS01107011.1.p1 GENE.GHVS01107011.1~~GHVS01107011.1.p1  ORF type:complete len:422 (+),score=46.67 GHVS01107011.1:182-1447(+)